MEKPIKIYRREALFIKQDDLTKKQLAAFEAHNTHHFFESKACETCEFLEDKLASDTGLADTCPNCAAYLGGVCLSKTVKIGSNKYLSIPGGDKSSIKKIVRGRSFKMVRKNKRVAFKRPIKFIGELRDHQGPAVEAILKKKYGVIKAPPRSGKTVLSTAAICRIGKKTIILAAQREWLDGFYETFCGSETQPPMTNAKKSQVGYPKTYEEFLKYDVCLVTYQTFNSDKGMRLLAKIRDLFTVCVIDEVHMGAATKFAICISRLNVEYRIGLSGTPNRKDKRFIIVSALVGPIIYKAKVKQLQPHVRLVRTKYHRVVKGNVPWHNLVGPLEKDPARLKLIAEWALRDVKEGHMLLIPFTQIKPIKALVMAINRMAGKKIAHEFHGSVKKPLRKKLIQDARTYKARILVGNAKLVSVGINIPRASCLYETFLSSNNENAEQRVARVLTAFDGKPTPLVRYFLDEMSVRKNCIRNEWFGAIKPKFKPLMSKKDETIFKQYLGSKNPGTPSWEM